MSQVAKYPPNKQYSSWQVANFKFQNYAVAWWNMYGCYLYAVIRVSGWGGYDMIWTGGMEFQLPTLKYRNPNLNQDSDFKNMIWYDRNNDDDDDDGDLFYVRKLYVQAEQITFIICLIFSHIILYEFWFKIS